MDYKLSFSYLNRFYGLETDGQVTFIQKWNELFNDYTVYLYKIKALGCRELLNELLNNIEECKFDDNRQKHLSHIQAECIKCLKSDIALNKKNMELVKTLLSDLGSKLDNNNKLNRLESKIRNFLNITNENNSYLRDLVTELKLAIDANNTLNVISLTESLANDLITCGWTKKSLFRLIETYFKHNSSDFDTKWEKFNRALFEDGLTYTLYFKINKDLKSIYSNLGINVKDYDTLVQSNEKLKNQISSNEIYAELKCIAKKDDLHAAVQSSKEKIINIHSTISYYISSTIEIDYCLVVFTNGNVLKYDIDLPWMNRTYKIDNIDKNTSKIESILNADINETSKSTLSNVFIQYNFALESKSLVTWYVNQWVCLESLVVTKQFDSILEHLTRFIPSILSNKYIYSILKDLLTFFDKTNIELTYNQNIIKTNDFRDEDIINLMNLLKDNNTLDSLLLSLNDFPLLKVRIKNLSIALNNSQSLKKFISAYNTEMIWHIWRLYRIRNELMHAAKVNYNLNDLGANLNIYLRIVLSEIIYRLSTHKFSSIEDIFIYLDDNYNGMIHRLDYNKKLDFTNELIIKDTF